MKLLLLCLLCLSSASLVAEGPWSLTGVVRSVNMEESTMVIAHEGVRGFAEESGELEVSVGQGDSQIAKPDAVIKGRLIKIEEDLLLENIWPAEPETERSMMLINRDLTRPRIGAVSKGILKVGDDLPRFALYNQRGELITPDNWENKAVVLNFIFTRGKVPSMSPASADRMAELQDKLEMAGLADAVCLASVSLDPEFDTPGICYEYLDGREVDHDGYWMLTGSKKTLDYLTKKIGVVVAPSEKTVLNHSMVVLIVDKEGKIFHRIPGTRWKLDDVYNRLEVMLKGWN